jgi:ribose/xylose/arabinose/galactoside ABC-type transport system permease subunit
MATTTQATRVSSPRTGRSALGQFVFQNRRALAALAVFIIMMSIFMITSPRVFTNPLTYRSVFTTLPVAIFIAVPLVFVIVSGEIDVSFPSTMGLASFAFALCLEAGIAPGFSAIVAIITGLVTGLVVGMLVNYIGLSSLVATLGMNFLLRGLINIAAEGSSHQLPFMRDQLFTQIFTGRLGGSPAGLPVQIFWGLLFIGIGWLIYNRHQFGAHVRAVGDNPDSALEMGINVKLTKTLAFVFVGFGAAIAGIMSVLINFVWWPSTGDGYLLTTLAAVFVGGTPGWGGVGTVVGAGIGVFITSFIETGIVAAGLTGFYTQFFNGLVIVASMIGHKFNGPRYR